MERWSTVFRILANINRLKIINLLAKKQLSVGDIAFSLKISVTATSNHLVMLQSMGVLKSTGTQGHVFYSLNKNMPKDFQEALRLFKQ